MRYEIATQLALPTSAGGLFEFSRGVEMGDDQAATLEVWVTRTNLTTWSLAVSIEGSNDLSSWTAVSGGSLTLSNASGAPGYTKVSVSSAVPWSFLRVRYKGTGTGPTDPRIVCRARVETYPLS